jgi:hypothetical protein
MFSIRPIVHKRIQQLHIVTVVTYWLAGPVNLFIS